MLKILESDDGVSQILRDSFPHMVADAMPYHRALPVIPEKVCETGSDEAAKASQRTNL
jgi:hypothetical protein